MPDLCLLSVVRTPFVQKSDFVSKKTWMVPFNIAAFKEDTVKTLRTLPSGIRIFGKEYKLAGYIMGSAETTHTSIGHFTAVILWKGNDLFYDGLLPDSCRLVPLNENIHILSKVGSNAIDLLAV
uniref:Uncharacterized protein n=1 Tax=Amphimedon queenslandica TaxID=400682 RepID=A0A1X7T6W5_AMPQE